MDESRTSIPVLTDIIKRGAKAPSVNAIITETPLHAARPDSETPTQVSSSDSATTRIHTDEKLNALIDRIMPLLMPKLEAAARETLKEILNNRSQ